MQRNSLPIEMWSPTQKDFDVLKTWGHEEDPFAAIKDFSELKCELRWLNPEHRDKHDEYHRRCLENINGKQNYDLFSKTSNKPIDKNRWEFLMRRKAWNLMPLGWENIPRQSCRILDIGCGDGDTIQRLIHFIENKWESENITCNKIEILGIDINVSRIENARALVKANHPNIQFEFVLDDACNETLNISDLSFDFTFCTGVIEVIPQGSPLHNFMRNLTRVTKQGIYSKETLDKYPGANPPWTLQEMLQSRGFTTKSRHLVLSEPFNLFKLSDPMKIWPIVLTQNLYAERC